MFELEGVDHVAIAVRDVQASARWYRDVLGLKRIHEEVWGDHPIMVAAGNTAIALFPVSLPAQPRPGRDTLAMRHFAFRASASQFKLAQSRLKELGIAFTFQDHTIAHSIYFDDPDGHQVEITCYEVE